MPAIAPAVDTVRQLTADSLAPILELHAELVASASPPLDVARARERLRAELVAYDPAAVLAASRTLAAAFDRAAMALERAGLASNADATRAREARDTVLALALAWLGGQPRPLDPVRAVALRAAGLVAHALLVRASRELLEGAPLRRPTLGSCPCCGSPPDLAVVAGRERLLVCSRCDARWSGIPTGCLGCGASTEPALARVESRALGYRLAICNACGRYLKERLTNGGEFDPLVERALTAQLDEAAELRGLRI